MTTLKPINEQGAQCIRRAVQRDRQHITEVLCDLLEAEKEVIRTVYDKQMEQRVHRLEEISKAQALIRQTLDPISSNER